MPRDVIELHGDIERSAQISRDADPWMLPDQFEASDSLPRTGIRLGIDCGLSSLVNAFDGAGLETTEPPW